MVSGRTHLAIVMLFPNDVETVARAIESIPEGERIHLAALKVSGGDLARLTEAIALAHLDWRDLLVEADFANDTTAHERWSPVR